jgi:hypothetical protein
MRRFAVSIPAFLAACATTHEPVQVHGVTPGHRCVASNAEQFVGQPGTSETGAAIMKATHAAVLRWAPIGYMLTMDFREDRVTVRLGADRRVTAISCG